MNHKKFKQLYVDFYRPRFKVGAKPSIAVLKYYNADTKSTHRFRITNEEVSALSQNVEIKDVLKKRVELYIQPAHFDKIIVTLKNTMDRPTQVHVPIFVEILTPMPEFADLIDKIEPDKTTLYDIIKIMTIGGF
jgi:hypothetical protein